MGIRGLRPDYVVVDGYGTGTATTACPACTVGHHKSCWQHDPPQSGFPFLACPCKVVAPGERYVVTSGRVPVATTFSTRPGFVIFDRSVHCAVGGWFAMESAAQAVAADMNGPSAADMAAAVVALREAIALL